MDAPIDVAVGVLVANDGRVLLAQRPAGKPMAGYWEFPGGKLEPGESVFDALVREFDEELGLSISSAAPWAQRVVVYPHATVRLHFWRSFASSNGWSGVPAAREAQDFRWERIDALTTDPWLPGALPLRRWLRLPSTYAISHASTVGVDAFIDALEQAVERGSIAQLQVREPGLDAAAFEVLLARVLSICRRARVRVLLNSAHAESTWARADGVHLTSRDLQDRAERRARPDVDWCLASCHDANELDLAAALGCDAAVLGPVQATASHPGAVPIGWDGFEAIARRTPLPTYAIGGVADIDLRRAIASGAHGIAMIRGAWAWTSTTGGAHAPNA